MLLHNVAFTEQKRQNLRLNNCKTNLSIMKCLCWHLKKQNSKQLQNKQLADRQTAYSNLKPTLWKNFYLKQPTPFSFMYSLTYHRANGVRSPLQSRIIMTIKWILNEILTSRIKSGLIESQLNHWMNLLLLPTGNTSIWFRWVVALFPRIEGYTGFICGNDCILPKSIKWRKTILICLMCTKLSH